MEDHIGFLNTVRRRVFSDLQQDEGLGANTVIPEEEYRSSSSEDPSPPYSAIGQPVFNQPYSQYAPTTGSHLYTGVPGYMRQGHSTERLLPTAPLMQGHSWVERPLEGYCPPGLQYLTAIDQLIVKQQVDIMEVITRMETANKYKVYNSLGQQVYNTLEESNCFDRKIFGPSRGFTMNFKDNQQQVVLKVKRPQRFFGAKSVIVEDRAGRVLGHVRKTQNYLCCWTSQLQITSSSNEILGYIDIPWSAHNCSGKDFNFKITSRDGSTEIGNITKQWSGLIKEIFTDADNFSVSFPMDMNVTMKATILGAVFLIDFMYFETRKKH